MFGIVIVYMSMFFFFFLLMEKGMKNTYLTVNVLDR